MAGQGSFSAAVDAWTRATRARMDAVRKEAVQRTIEVMQTPVAKGGNLPVDTGYMRSSLLVSIGDALPPLTDKPEGGGSFTYNGGQAALTIARSQIEDTITAAYGAKYAPHQEYGSRGRPGRRFVALAAQQWPRIVEETIRDAKAAVASR